MKYLKYPKTTSDLNRLIIFLDRNMQDISSSKNPKNKSRETIRIFHNANHILNEAKISIQKLEESNQNINQSNTTTDLNFHKKVINNIEKWMKTNKFPIW